MNLLKKLPPFDSKSGNLNVLIDTPKGCRSKFAYDMKRKAYVLPDGGNSREYLARFCQLELEPQAAKRGAWGKVNP